MNNTDKYRTRLINLLKELFQLDQPELDFGFYKIMHAKSVQITHFLENDLLKVIQDAFGEADGNRIAEARENYEAALEQAKKFGAPNPEETDGVKEAKAIYEQAKDGGNAESEVYDHLYRFFERYYDNGDFMSRRYYARESDSRAAPYAVPYDGREVYLHWANKDQYYIKSSEYLTNYSFDLNEAIRLEAQKAKGQGMETFADHGEQPLLKVHFRIVAASEGEHGNIKAASDQKRFFLIHKAVPVVIENGELIIQFEYRPDPEKTGQDNKWQETRLREAEAAIVKALQNQTASANFLKGLTLPAPTDSKDKRTLLGKYLQQYAARNTMDYFIHKNLGGFLRRELDFYIKNEIMRLDDIESADAPQVEHYLAKIRVFRKIAKKLILFLAQLEEFQKKLWLKKKFVTETNYCITLNKIPEKFYLKIAANDRQHEEWIQLFGIDENNPKQQQEIFDNGFVPYSKPLTIEFLKANQSLMIDTANFDADFCLELISEIEQLDEAIDGLLIHSDNFHGLNLLQNKYSNSIKSVYLDPPYNTAVSAIPYKNSYRHSSWGTMMQDRLALIRGVMKDASACYVSIDKNERNLLEAALNNVFGESNKIEELIWIQNTNDGRATTFSTNHEYVEVYSKDKTAAENDYSLFREPKPGCEEVMELIARLNPEYPSSKAIEQHIRALYKEHLEVYKEEIQRKGLNWDEEKRNDPWNGVYQYKFSEYRDSDGKYVSDSEARLKNATIRIYRESDWTIMESDQKQSSTTKDPNHPNYRYYQPLHPRTGKPCAMPSRGWKGTQFIDPEYPNRNSWESLLADNRIAFGEDEKKVPQQKRFLHNVDTNVAKSIIVGSLEILAKLPKKGDSSSMAPQKSDLGSHACPAIGCFLS